MWDIVFNTIGIIGVALILLGYVLIQTRRVTVDMLIYPLLNLIGSLLLLISLFWAWNAPSVIIQLCWIAISLYGITRIVKNKPSQPNGDRDAE